MRAAKVLHRSSSRRKTSPRRAQREALQRLAIDAGSRPTHAQVRAWRDRVADEDVDAWLYGVELVCRSEGRTQGVRAMGLWRRMSPAQRADLATTIESARRRLLESLADDYDMS